MENIDKILYSLSKSKFRSSFHLKEKDKEYIKDKGMDKIREHAKDFITKRLAPKVINNDGKQTQRTSCIYITACNCNLL